MQGEGQWHNLNLAPLWTDAPQTRLTGQALMQAAQAHAQARGCCKLTLEVLTGNARALRSYTQFGFEPYTLDPAAGQASFMQKWL